MIAWTQGHFISIVAYMVGTQVLSAFDRPVLQGADTIPVRNAGFGTLTAVLV